MTNAERQKRYRERKRNGNVTPSVTESVTSVTESVMDEDGSVTPVTDIYDKERYPNRAAWEVAVIRAQRARRYALACPEHVRLSERIFQEIGWQYEHEGLPAVRRSVGG